MLNKNRGQKETYIHLFLLAILRFKPETGLKPEHHFIPI
jgi:hypothetical protein